MTIWLIVLIAYAVVFAGILAFVYGANRKETPKPDGLKPCPIDSDCGDNQGGGCGLMPHCMEDYIS